MRRQTSPESRPPLWVLLLAPLALAATSCRHAPLAEGPGDHYTLVSVDGRDVPANVQHEGQSVWVYSGALFLGADQTCASRTVFSPPSSEEKESRKVDCTYERDGDRLTMQWKGAGQTVGDIDGDRFTMDNHGMLFRYRRTP